MRAAFSNALCLPDDTLECDVDDEREADCWCRFDKKVHIAKSQSGSH